MKVMLIACEPCRQRKRKCDRAYPSCSLCQKTARPCCYAIYRVTETAQNQKPRALVNDGHRERSLKSISPDSWEAVSDQLYLAWAVQSPAIPESYPIAPRWYMPRLIKHFLDCHNVSQVPMNANCSAYKLQTVWLRSAMSDPCLFHATLFVGSSNFDLCRGQKQSTITLYHYNELIQMVKKRLSDPSTALDDRTIASITPLALFANLHGDRVSADVHRAGLEKIVLLKGGLDKLGLDGLVASLVYVNGIISNIIFDLGWGSSSYLQHLPPLGLEERILSTPVSDDSTCSIMSLFYYVQQLKLQFMAQSPTAAWHHDTLQGSTMPSSTTNNPIYQCCYLAFRIFQMIVLGGPSASNLAEKLDAMAQELRDALALTEDEIWLRSFPSSLTWACITGAAASSDPQARAWFYFRTAAAVGLLDVVGDLSFLEDLSLHFTWLRSLRWEAIQLNAKAL
ncbi:Zn(II)2Cys6 transcription factor [Aspergillus homomorphus CBS 101889]|uniref:Zn(2)-C6 fungal-type domain-containing protein n=1 Tax=Aspergillus homomorphus (strain CBS 101889) TaxID=1450537 RepID=A0A395I9Z4_ASPHC|nr:hypothetical protein BO97DRAFT_176756 [Aspergillus homomorphus CBS 101889]RAL15888.1 hypothetical protein BO97DRAFT_176756 [Aspergillus homomorphus CBS 101889]